MTDVKNKDFPFEDVVREVKRYLREYPNVLFYQKFTCAGCGQRLGMETPNHFYETGTCDKCSTVTDIKKQGCNYMMHMKFDGGIEL